MTKVEMLHCAACKVHVSTSAAEVQAHVSSLEHLTNTKVRLLTDQPLPAHPATPAGYYVSKVFHWLIILFPHQGFEVQQRHSCLSKAEAMLKKLQPQFELFLKVFRAAQLIKGAELKIFLKIYVKSIFEFYLMLHYYSLIKKVAGVLS